MSHFRLHTKSKGIRRQNVLIMGIICVLAAAAAGYGIHSMGTARAKSRETVLIYTEEELEQYLLDRESEEYNLNGRYRLEADLELGWLKESIGSNLEPFTGTFDGNGHVINGLERPLFGVMKRAEVENLFLSGAVISHPVLYHDGERYVDGYAGLAGYAVDSVIRNCGVGGEIHMATPMEAEYLLEKASPSDADEERGPGMQENPGGQMPSGQESSGPAGPGVGQETESKAETESESELEAGPGVETESSQPSKPESTQPVETESAQASEAESTHSSEPESTQPAETESTQATEAESTRPSEMEPPQSSEPESTRPVEPDENGTPETSPGNENEAETGNSTGQGTALPNEGNTSEAVTKPEGETSSSSTQRPETGTTGSNTDDDNTTDGSGRNNGGIVRDIGETLSSAAIAETVGYRSVTRQNLAMKAASIVDINTEEFPQASPPDAEEATKPTAPATATPSNTLPPEQSPENNQETGSAATQESAPPIEEPQYIGNPNGDLYILVTAESIVSGGLIAQAAGETMVSNCFTFLTAGSEETGVPTCAGGLAGILGEHTRVENSYSSGMLDSHEISAGFAAVNDGIIQDCYSTVVIGNSGATRGAFIAAGNGELNGCVYDRQIACTSEEDSQLVQMEQEGEGISLKGFDTIQLSGTAPQIPGEWYTTEHAYPQITCFASSEHETIREYSKVSVITLILPSGTSLEDVVEENSVVLPSSIDGEEIRWEAEEGGIIDEQNRIQIGSGVTVSRNQAPRTASSLAEPDSTKNEEEGADSTTDGEASDSNTSSTKIQLKATLGSLTRNFTFNAAARAASADTTWGTVGEAIYNGTVTGTDYKPVKNAAGEYEIKTPEALACFSYMVKTVPEERAASAKLMNDIDLSGTANNWTTTSLEWKPIGVGDESTAFTGTFDGGNHKIHNLTITDPAGNPEALGALGLFGYINGATIKGVILVDLNISVADSKWVDTDDARYPAGIVSVGYGNYLITECGVESGSVKGTSNAGGILCSSRSFGTISKCYNKAAVSSMTGVAHTTAGGIVSRGQYGQVTQCYNMGVITCDSGQVDTHVGGIWGFIMPETRNVRIKNCYNTGSVSAYTDSDAITINRASVTDCFYLINSGNGVTGAAAVSDSVMKTWSFAYQLNGWTVDGGWKYNPDDYPSFGPLSCDWEKVGEAIYNDTVTGTDYKPVKNAAGEYEIKTPEALACFSYMVKTVPEERAASAKLMNDIDLSGTTNNWTTTSLEWQPIGVGGESTAFTGTIDGGNHKIHNLTITDGMYGPGALGLFGYINGATIKGVTLIDVNISLNDSKWVDKSEAAYAAGIAAIGYGDYLIIECGVESGNVWGVANAGGIMCDSRSFGTISKCYNKVDCSALAGLAHTTAGGIVSRGQYGQVIQCYNTGTVTCERTQPDTHAAGIWGFAIAQARDVRISNCYNTGSVSAQTDSWAIAAPSKMSMSDCYYLINSGNGGTGTTAVSDTAMKTWFFAYRLNGRTLDGGWKYNPDDYPSFGPLTACDWEKIGEALESGQLPSSYTKPLGDGNESSPYSINNAEQFAWFAYQVNHGTDQALCARLEADIDLFGGNYTGTVSASTDVNMDDALQWIPIGSTGKVYKGTLDGNGHVIQNLAITTSLAWQGVVGVLGDGAVVKDIGVATGKLSLGGEAGAALVGEAAGTGTKILRCWNEVDITGNAAIHGGILGKYSGSSLLVDGCWNTGNVSAVGVNDIGGVVGKAMETSQGLTVRNCYNMGNVSGRNYVGGVVATLAGSGHKVSNCYNTGTVRITEGSAVGGITGTNAANPSPANCYYLEGATGGSGAVALTDKQLRSWGAAFALNGYQLSQSTGISWTYHPDKSSYPTISVDGLPVPDWEMVGEALDYGLLPSDKTKPTGSGTSSSPYQIKEPEQMAWLAYQVNSGTQTDACATLLNNIDLTGTAYTGTSGAPLPWIPISNYSGAFGVKNTEIYELSGLHIGTTASSVNAGLFDTVSGTVARTAVIKSTLTSSGGKQGAITGVLNGGTIYQCYSRENVGSGASYAGGIAGQMTGAASEIRDCYTLKPQLSASGSGSAAGGIAGDGSSGKIQNCYNALLSGGTITAGGRAGSIAGNAGTGNLVRCYSDTSLSDSSQVTRFDTTADAKRQEQTAELNNYGGSARVGADRVWYTSLNSESTAGYPTFVAPKTVSVEFASDTPEGGSTVNLKDSLSIPDMKLRSFGPSDSNFTPGSTGAAGNSFSLSAFADITGANSNYHKYGYTNANTYLGFRAGGTDLKGLASSLASPAASLQTVSSISLGRAAACTKPEDRYVLLEGASGTQRYEIQITVKGVTSKTLSVVMPVKVTMAKLTPDGRAHKDYSLDLKITNKNGYPIDGKILKAVSKSGYTKLTSVLPSISLPSTGNITDASGGVRLAITDVQGASPALVGSRYYDEAGAAAGTAWMEYRLKNGGSLPYRYAMEYNGLHFGTEAQFSYDIHYWFGISKDDYTAAAQAVVP